MIAINAILIIIIIIIIIGHEIHELRVLARNSCLGCAQGSRNHYTETIFCFWKCFLGLMDQTCKWCQCFNQTSIDMYWYYNYWYSLMFKNERTQLPPQVGVAPKSDQLTNLYQSIPICVLSFYCCSVLSFQLQVSVFVACQNRVCFCNVSFDQAHMVLPNKIASRLKHGQKWMLVAAHWKHRFGCLNCVLSARNLEAVPCEPVVSCCILGSSHSQPPVSWIW